MGGRRESWDGEKQPKRRLSFLFHIADERNSDVKIACLSTLSYGTLLQLPMIERPPLTCNRYCRNA